MGSLLIHAASVVETPRRFTLECDPDCWDRTRAALRELEVELRRPFQVELQGHRIGARLLFRGELRGAVEFDCSSCLDPFVQEWNESVHLLLEPAPAAALVPEGGVALDPDDIELGRYAGEELDLEPLVMEILALTWPIQPRCAEGCKGLCAVCGVNRNRESCRCGEPGTSRPFAGLRELLKRASRQGG